MRLSIVVLALLMLCLGGVVWGSTLKSNFSFDEITGASFCIEKPSMETSATVAAMASGTSVQGLGQKEHYFDDFKAHGIPESGSFLIFTSGVIGMIGIGWVKKKKI